MCPVFVPKYRPIVRSRPHTITFAEIIGRKALLVTDKLAQNHLLASN